MQQISEDISCLRRRPWFIFGYCVWLFVFLPRVWTLPLRQFGSGYVTEGETFERDVVCRKGCLIFSTMVERMWYRRGNTVWTRRRSSCEKCKSDIYVLLQDTCRIRILLDYLRVGVTEFFSNFKYLRCSDTTLLHDLALATELVYPFSCSLLLQYLSQSTLQLW